MSADEIRDLCKRAFMEAFQERSLAAIDELFAPDMARLARLESEHWHRVTPDLQYTIEDTIVEGDKAVLSWTCVSTQTGELWGIPPTGKRFTDAGISILRVADGKIVEISTQWDAFEALMQLGAIPQAITEGWQAYAATFQSG